MEWAEVYHSLVRKRNSCEGPLDAIVEEHCRLQQEFAAVVAEAKVLKGENTRLAKENELLSHDLNTAGHSKGSAPRVKSLEAQVEALQSDFDEFRRSQQRVITKYDDDLAEAKKQLELSQDREKKLQREIAELEKKLQTTSRDLHSTQESLQRTNEELEATERARETLIKESLMKMETMQHVKIKAVTKAVEDFIALRDTRDMHKVVHLNTFMRDVVVDAIEMMGSDGEQHVAEVLHKGYGDASEMLTGWVEYLGSEVKLFTDVLLKKETWVAVEAETRSRGLSLLVPKMASYVDFLTSSCFPCSQEWNIYCAYLTDAVLQCVSAASATTALPPLPSLTFRLNTISHIAGEFMQLLTSISEQWAARPSYAKGTGGLNCASLLHTASAGVQTFTSDTCVKIATQAMASVHRLFDDLYIIDMSHYKKYKHKDAYTKVCAWCMCTAHSTTSI
eukprot:TRINITY_DN14547_c2_g1_i1.p1 TRINITY_DN14547_c2_g1~~TRINITY_DN14547_c2_g1_i1.p1  ORF type:complete len:449 (+),score=128.58 TRINITY_DN14547_c2_g1_i1:31-1377(+)